jgi:hypothetical protein
MYIHPASNVRQDSFASGQRPVIHWFPLGRPLIKISCIMLASAGARRWQDDTKLMSSLPFRTCSDYSGFRATSGHGLALWTHGIHGRSDVIPRNENEWGNL